MHNICMLGIQIRKSKIYLNIMSTSIFKSIFDFQIWISNMYVPEI